MKWLHTLLTRFPKTILITGVAVLLGAGIYGFGLFGSLGDGGDNFFASNTPAEQVNQKVNDIFGSGENSTAVILFEAKDRSANVRDASYALEITTLLKRLDATSTTSYFTTGSDQFISRDGNDTYAVVTLEGTADEQYTALTQFVSEATSDTFDISLGGTLVGQRQTREQVAEDLALAEIVSLPILAVLLFWFFRGPIAAAIPLVMSALTIAGALALSRIISVFFPIDSYTLNVITILSVGLSVDYSLLAVNRFRDEIHHKGRTPAEAARIMTRTAGRTVFFSGMTVIVCLLSLLLFPVDFMHSISIGGAAAVVVAVIISTFLLAPALQLLGKNIDKWSIKHRTTGGEGWKHLATFVTKRPYIALAAGVVIIAALVWPVTHFQTKAFDWHVLPSNQSAHHVGQVMSERFDIAVPSLTVLATFPSEPTVAELCQLAETVSKVENIESVQAAYAPTEGMSDCKTMPYTIQGLQLQAPEKAAVLEKTAATYVSGNFARVEVVPVYDASDSRIRGVMNDLQDAAYGTDITVSVTGQAARAQDTLDVYRQWMPYVIGVIALAMIILLSLLLGSVILPLQAIVINSLALFISLGVLIMIFQFGWGAEQLNMNATGGFELSIPILIFVIAFGLSMDYAVFLYSRMHEIYDTSGDVNKSIIDGVVKTGPIITAAALLLFTVVAAFATSRIALIQQIGVGLAVAVLVDAFFVRIIFVPAVMKLFGRTSWWGPKWLKKITIKHE